MENYKLSPVRYVTKFGIIIQRWYRGNDVFVSFCTYESVYLSFLALQGKQQSFGFQDIAINVKLLTKYVMPDTLPQ